MQRVLRRQEVCEFTGLSYSTIYRLEKAGKFPRRLKIGPQAVGWRLAQVEDWLDAQTEVATGAETAARTGTDL